MLSLSVLAHDFAWQAGLPTLTVERIDHALVPASSGPEHRTRRVVGLGSRSGRAGLEYFYAFCDLADAVHDCVWVFELVRKAPCAGLLELVF